MVSVGRNQACPQCGSEVVIYSARSNDAECPGKCADEQCRPEFGPECCIGDELVEMVCNDCGATW